MRRFKNKDDMLRVVVNCALLYEKNLAYKTVLFVTDSKENTADFEALFMPQNFKHLTGVAETNINPVVFYNRAIGGKLSARDITFDARGFAAMKLDVLQRLMNIHMTARMVGDFDGLSERIVADKFAGTTVSAMGFNHVNNYYVPVTSLKENVNNVTKKASRSRVIAIFTKNKDAAIYRDITYKAHNVSFKQLQEIEPLCKVIDFEGIMSSNS